MALGSGAGGGGLNRVIRRQRRRGAPTATGAGTPNTPTPTTSYPSSGGGYTPPPATVPAVNAVTSSSRAVQARPKPTFASADRGRGAVLARVLQSIEDPAARALAPDAIRAARETGIPASVLLALSGQESDFGRNQGPSSAGAQGVTQFIPSTRDMMIEKYGVDPWKSPREGLKAAGLYLKELGFNGDPQGALSAYSGGYAAADYNNPILASSRDFRALDRVARGKAKVKAPRPLRTEELYYDKGINLRDGQPTSPVGGHDTHVHYASNRPRDILRAARVAQRFGADVSENTAFGGVAPVHAGTDAVAPASQAQDRSFHYRALRFPRRLRQSRLAQKVGASGKTITEAIDISGGDLGAINKRLAALSGSPAGGAYPDAAGGGGGVLGGLTAAAGSSSGGTPTFSPYSSAAGGNAVAAAQTTGRQRQAAVVASPFSAFRGQQEAAGGTGFPDLMPDPDRSPQDLLEALTAYGARLKPRRRRQPVYG